MRGAAGTDEVSYADRTKPVVVVLDGKANDGEAERERRRRRGRGERPRRRRQRPPDRLLPPNHLIGGAGNDLFDGGEGADVFEGGAGADAVGYTGRTKRVVASLDGQANDGEAGENDAIAATSRGSRALGQRRAARRCQSQRPSGQGGDDTIQAAAAPT